jgi:uncharacterized protein (DUF2062 family)
VKDSLVQRRLVAPVIALLTQGITPEKIALSLAFGLVLGVFPVLGSTTLLCATAALLFGLNLPAIQLINYVVYPLQLILLLPFIRTGERLFGASPLQLSLTQMLAMAKADMPHAVRALWVTGAHAAVAWLLVGPPAILLFYLILAWVLRKVAVLSESQTRGDGS